MSYNLEQYTTPVWEGDTVYHESVLFIEDEEGKVTAPALLYTPGRILSVASRGLDKTYVLGKDFTVEGNKIVLTADTSIPVMPYSEYIADEGYAATKDDATKFVKANKDVAKYQLYVSYTHADAWTLEKPKAQLSSLPGLKAKLEAKENVNLLFVGDSITEGFETSSKNNVAPYMPTYATMVTDALKVRYDYNGITAVNGAYRSTTTAHGITQHIPNNMTADTDVVFIAYGMNQYNDTTNYPDHIRQMMDYCLEVNPEVEFVLVSTMTANTTCAHLANNVLSAQEDLLDTIAGEYSGTVVAPVNTMFESIQTVKRYIDITGNFINHPNDFGARLYAQIILTVLS